MFSRWILSFLLAAIMGVASSPAPHSYTPSVDDMATRSATASVGPLLTLHGWLPFWAKASGTAEILQHPGMFTTVSPFSYEVNPDGSLFDRFARDGELWKMIKAASSSPNVKIMPTIAWFNPEQIDETLSSTSLRALHIERIVEAVENNDFDGIDIDYEGKWLKTRDAYSQFIKELSFALTKKKKILQCTVEARTPAEDRLWQLPRGMSHASDYGVLNKYCNTIRIMAYDQRDDDQTLVYENGDDFYRPVADTLWVEKTIKEAIYEIDRKKLVLGIPTYGNIYSAVKGTTHTTYTHVGAVNYRDAVRRALQYKVSPFRNAAGELQYGYVKNGTQYYVSFTDAVAVKKKLLLAEKYGLYGVALFKIDGTMDKHIWGELGALI